MFFRKKEPKVPVMYRLFLRPDAASQYELSDEVKEEIRANIMQQERMIQHVNAVKKYEAQVREEIRLEQGYICTCDDEWADGCDVHNN